MSNKFLYFAYGSNMLMKRIHINNPTAIRKDIGFLKNFRLDFLTHSKRWGGCSATIVPTKDYVVWGAIWELDECNMCTLDNQEGVADKLYFPLVVDIETVTGKILKCRVYQQCKNPDEHIKLHLLPIHRRPSPLYLETIIKGAHESHLPHDYIKFLETIPPNGYMGEYDIGLPLQEV
ncbi:gamma-glutamylcyclotransferase [Apis mellifera caucasica]|uniref:gamma-glutamylcyclotransferase n=1 Tax=Apis mellifera TaxID=7460 RepID=A0A7M7LR86_APIME|nr:gamma-glutamylcyclotransferase [Apis mellifera]KAG6794618.1 gamma-glutamylcyclotransferase [Apis mellifera caucasica]KAG9429483.1 gamma-glutamylcyclotransferase [Apis mellifera carnica]|eukprot:XP_006563149.2 gamma-glutamylcyclotransferase [Apis mellifera]